MYEIVTQEQFEQKGREISRHQNVITRAWKSSLYLTAFIDHRITGSTDGYSWDWYGPDYPKELNFIYAVAGIRYMETGQHHSLLIGRTAWDTLAAVNNAGLSVHDPDYILPWTDHIHSDFRNGIDRRERAAERLAAAYTELGRVATTVV